MRKLVTLFILVVFLTPLLGVSIAVHTCDMSGRIETEMMWGHPVRSCCAGATTADGWNKVPCCHLAIDLLATDLFVFNVPAEFMGVASPTLALVDHDLPEITLPELPMDVRLLNISPPVNLPLLN